MIFKTETEIKKNWQGDHAIPVVSVCCLTYNHVKYITQAIESFLLQETKFPFEVLISDDASTDGTTKLLEKYQNNYPNIIRTFIQTENLYTQGPMLAFNYLYPLARGKYIALCEGDDYWIDNNKLQKQVDWLERNNNYSMCTHSVKMLNDTIDKVPFYPTVDWTKSDNDFLDILHNHFIPTPSVLFRNLLDNYPFYGPDSVDMLAGDMAIELFMASKGLCYYDKEAMGVYRNHDNGITKRDPEESSKAIFHWTTLYTKINEVTDNRYRKELYYKMSEICINYAFYDLVKKNYKKSYTHFLKCMEYGFNNFIIVIFQKLFKKVKKLFIYKK